MLPTDYHEIGHYLRDSRESLRVSLETAARDLHIRRHYLEALETGSIADLPGKAYMRGYIRNYAHYLRLDADKVLEAYAPLMGPRTPDLFIPEPALQQNMPTPRLLWGSLAGLCLLYAYWYYGLHDRDIAPAPVADLPPKIAHLLDKPLPAGMDNAWYGCLTAGNSACTLFLRPRALNEAMKVLYDVEYDNPPQEP